MTARIVIPDRLNMVTFFLDDRVEEGRGDDVAIVHSGLVAGGDVATAPTTEVTYRELVTASCRVTGLLRELGLRIEDRVQLLLLDTPEFAAAYFGILRAGCVAVPTNTWLQPRTYAYTSSTRARRRLIRRRRGVADARAVEGPPHTQATVIVLDRKHGKVPDATISTGTRRCAPAAYAKTEPTYRTLLDMAVASGSTRQSEVRRAMHHDFVWNTIAYAQRTLGLRPTDVTISAPKAVLRLCASRATCCFRCRSVGAASSRTSGSRRALPRARREAQGDAVRYGADEHREAHRARYVVQYDLSSRHSLVSAAKPCRRDCTATSASATRRDLRRHRLCREFTSTSPTAPATAEKGSLVASSTATAIAWSTTTTARSRQEKSARS